MSPKDAINIFGIFCYLLVLVIHLIGLILLIQIKSSHRLTTFQYVCLINLSIIEIYFCVSGIAIRVSHLFGSQTLNYYVTVFTGCGFGLWYFSTMVLLTVDRFLAVYLNIHYKRIISPTRIKYTLLISFVLAVSVTTVIFGTDSDIVAIEIVLQKYAWPTVHTILLFVVVSTYTYLFHRIRYFRNKLKNGSYRVKNSSFRQEPEEVLLNPTTQNLDTKNDVNSLMAQLQDSSKVTTKSSVTTQKRRNIPTSFRTGKKTEQLLRFNRARRGFYLPTLLIVTYLLFWTLPDFIYFGCRLDGKRLKDRSPMADAVVSLIYIVGLLCDACIYIFGVPEVRQLLAKKIPHCITHK